MPESSTLEELQVGLVYCHDVIDVVISGGKIANIYQWIINPLSTTKCHNIHRECAPENP